MFTVQTTQTFDDWFDGLRDRNAKVRIVVQLRKLELGNLGDAKPIGHGISEIRLHFGPGYRLYFTKRGRSLIVLLCGGTKRRQKADIQMAKLLKDGLD